MRKLHIIAEFIYFIPHVKALSMNFIIALVFVHQLDNAFYKLSQYCFSIKSVFG